MSGSKRLKLNSDELLSISALNFNVRRYTKAKDGRCKPGYGMEGFKGTSIASA
jgi:hypothetical protein